MAIPGLKVVAPSTPADVVGLMAAAIRDPDPVIFCEHKALFADQGRGARRRASSTRSGRRRCVRDGTDATIVALAAMVPKALEAAERLAAEHGVSTPRSSTCARSCRSTPRPSSPRSTKTSRLFTVEENPRLCGWGAEIASIVADEGFYSLDAPIVRITTPHIPLPSAAALEDLAVPSVERIVETVKRRLDDAA